MTIKLVVKEEGARPIKIWTSHVEDAALSQLKNIARLPFIHYNGVSAMPDVHMGKGSSIGTVIATDKAVIPSAVGVDIGCGMNAVRLSLKASQLPDNLTHLRHAIESVIPLGKGGEREGTVRNLSEPMPHSVIKALEGKGDFIGRAVNQIGTLGSGNHFIELCIDEKEEVWIMLHSGSRGTGNIIGNHYIEKAKRNMEKFFIHLPDDDLAYLPAETEDFNNYVEAVNWAQNYAFDNRRVMMEKVVEILRKEIPIKFEITEEAINCHHNYIEKENHFGRNLWITRKGAIRARKGDLGIIPSAMGQKSYIVKGKGELQSYCSCSHGAGRRMSRTEARRQFTLADLEEQTKGIECPKTDSVLDEIPSAYKDMNEVMENQTDLIEVIHTLQAVLNIKGN